MKRGEQTDEVLLGYIHKCIERIKEYTDGGRSEFLKSCLVQDAVIRNLQTLAESTQRLSSVLKESQPSIPWRAIAGFRNVLAHNYFEVDLDAVWDVVESDLPALASSIGHMMRAMRSGDDLGM